jgi:LytR cell envelope-related transcriptional attenuator
LLDVIEQIGAFAGLVAFIGLALLTLLAFTQGRDIRRLREWAGSAPERDADRKETTSAAASERAEEVRKLEEAREAERRAADLREERRQRREAGLPELTRSERLRESLSGRGAWLGEPRHLAAILVAVVAVVAVGAYAATGGFSGEEAKGGRGGGTAAAALRPGEIEVTVLNGTAVPGLAATYGDMVEQRGFQLGRVSNSESSFEESVVMFAQDSGRAAHRVADSLEISRVRPMDAEIASLAAGAPVAIVIGEDNASSAG